MTAMGTLRIHHSGTFCMSSSTDLRYAAGKVHDEDIEYHRVTLSYLEERVKSLGYMHFKDIYYRDPYVEKFGEAVKVINSKQEFIHMRYLLNERGIIDVYVEHVCDEPDILDLLEGCTVMQEPIDEGTMDIGEGCVIQNSQPAPNFHEALETAAEGDADETDALHGGDAAQQEDLQYNDHDDEDLLDIVPSDADDEEVLESIHNKKKHKASASARKNADGVGPSGTVHDSPTTVNEEGKRVPIGTDDHGDLGFDFSFENIEDEFEVSSDNLGEYNVADEHELEEEEEDVRSTRSSDLWFNPSWTTVWFEVGMRFEHVAQFKEAIAKYQIQKDCKLKPIKSDPTRQRIHCVGQQCNWSIFASFDKNDKTFKVKTYCREHTCFRSLKSNMVGSRVLAEHHKNRIISNPQIRTSEIVRLSHLELGVHVSRDKRKLAKERIVKKVKETHTKEFAQLRGYAEKLLILSPQSNVQIDSEPLTTPEGKPMFKGIYVCLEGCRKGFLLGCRPIIGVDACFLKGMFKGTILAAVARDGNNQMFPIAWAVVDSESTSSWTFFFRCLADDLSNHTGRDLTFISDQHPGLINVRQTVFPEARHRLCARHLYANWQKIFKGKLLKKRFWIAARSTYEGQFNKNMEGIRNLSVEGHGALKSIPPELWCKAFFDTLCKCDVVDNNMNETFNNWIMDARYMPIIQLLEYIRVKVMVRMAKNREEINKWRGDIAPRIRKKLEAHKFEAAKCRCEWNGRTHYDVWHWNDKFVVDLIGKNCSCRAWDLTGIPCLHALSAIGLGNFNLDEFVSIWYKRVKYECAYNVPIVPCNGEKFWENYHREPLEPLPFRCKQGRPKVNRRKGDNETRKVKVGQLETMTREGGQITCSLCKQPGHNKRGCHIRPTKSEGASVSTHQPIPRKPPTCVYCKQPGHTRATCTARYFVDENQGLQGEIAMRHTHPSQFHKAQPPRKSTKKKGSSEA
ncbi:hypothetical protein SLEP1_g4653 [Rubroshorea leprosula]|uniref:SWIM-type domain-containing protein n=1 Tax=Rubroshorea leprosula TaxID=152421 RepID=A0AAV5HYX0_9ROSI|nr:hypothetical protein SLEP1_g4653 [Rubroshorea leprosula]